MDPNIKQLECGNFRNKAGEHRKRAASGRLSPRSLFGNIKMKKPLQDEDAVSRNLNNSKNTHGWKPPLKSDSNEASNKFSNYECDKENLSLSFPNHENNVSQHDNFIKNETNYSGSNENLHQMESGNIYGLESNESFRGNSKETTVFTSDFSNQNNLMNNQDLSYSEENICSELCNYINNSETVVNPDSVRIQINSGQDQENRNIFQPVMDKLDFPRKNHEYGSSQETDISQRPNPSRNEINFENNNYGTNETLSQDTVKLERDDVGQYVDMETHYKDEEQEYSEKSDSSKSTLELKDSQKFSMRPNNEENKNVIPQEINYGNYHEDADKENKESYAKIGVDDSFDTGVTNSQFLQLENQISKSSMGMNMKNCYDNRPFLNNLETMKRYCTSLTAQTEWQKNVIKSITRDIDDLNKAIVNATGALRSLRRENASAK